MNNKRETNYALAFFILGLVLGIGMGFAIAHVIR